MKVLVVGATSRLGERVVPLLLDRGAAVRALTRNPNSQKALHLNDLGVEVTQGDLRDRASLDRACQSVEKVVALAHGLVGDRTNNPLTVDLSGNRSLVDAAGAAQVNHFVFVSVLGAGPSNKMEFARCKYAAEEYLRKKGLSYTILRCAFFMEAWGAMIGGPIIEKGKATIFGTGNNPISFVSANDVANYIIIALTDPRATGQILDVAGSERFSLNQIADAFEKVCGRKAKRNYVPLPILRAISILVRPFNPSLGRLMEAAVLLNTENQVYDMSDTLSKFPVRLTCLNDVAREMADAQKRGKSK